MDIFKAKKTGKLRKFMEIYGSGFFEAKIGALPARCNLTGRIREK